MRFCIIIAFLRLCPPCIQLPTRIEDAGGLDLEEARARMAVADAEDKLAHRERLRQLRWERKRKERERRNNEKTQRKKVP